VPQARRIEIGSRLRDSRNALKLSQRDVASQLGVSDSAVSSWEAGERMPGAEALADVCLVYGVSADYILFGTDMVPRDLRDLFARTTRASPGSPPSDLPEARPGG
jgi:transcriptional regulator with XRE-family HTH domain